jgi:peptidoglycan/xylan/chitin deacetylase (PgdA/CDA1 family)
MYIGHHGYEHCWLDSLTQAEQEREIDVGLEFLDIVGSSTDNWIMCYPYGAFDENLLRLLRSRGCAAGLTTRVDLAILEQDDPLLLPRLDTNDLPKNGSVQRKFAARRH